MYLSRIDLNPMRRQARWLLGNPQAMHATVMGVCTREEPSPSSGGRILWRVDEDGDNVCLYIVSPQRPDLADLSETIGWDGATASVADYDPFLERLEIGRAYAFRLTANPTHVVTMDDGRKRRLGHVTVEYQRSWLLEHANRMGLQIPTTETGHPDVVVHDRQVRTFQRQHRPVTLTIATFDGRGVVANVEALCKTLVDGIGPAKAYGCGLLTLASPAPR
ncbi:type I-E CRISPR-associated protein Cas6/Cse3/CasE [Brooklawnia cerclae]|uniref:CRISPR system Cascade subunit CasE n=1 Tax=Brooklawnia cerclae TaxID=349934 RepID=A0ABX0SI65_9ACTN|nr:type I-E CRISPR-associated protein Cas6/Cse3/CasE [Brooklawnia cerclae]NIH57670.1 CRISPR system Cascade subunit CasE [Brooklawnia cerclae]